MGVKHFFIYLKNNFGKHIKSLKNPQTFSTINTPIDNLMIDLNGVFHSATQKIYQYGAGKVPVSILLKHKKKSVGGIKQQIQVFEEICKTIDKLFYITAPKKRLILCVDGPAPASKSAQQRARRFKSAMEKTDEEFTKFDQNSISVGTKFMNHLTKYIDWYIRKRISLDPLWKNIDVIFSGDTVPSEGEQKLMTYIRLYGDLKDTFCIHGLDADLIMLALVTHFPNFYIIRDDLYDSKNDYFVVDIGNIRKDLCAIMDWTSISTTHTFNPKWAINDFVFLCFTVGNDFVPHVPSLEILEGSIDQMLEIYRNVGKTYGHLTSDSKMVTINKKALEIFFGTISLHDKKFFEDKIRKKDKFFPDLLLEKHTPFKNGRYELNIEKYKEEYYHTHFENVDIKSLCLQYIEGLQWVLSYYTRGVPDWKWCFRHHYAPFAHELATHMSDFKHPDIKKTSPVLPFFQLLSILPPKSSNLLPHPLNILLTDKNSPIKQFCPESFHVDVSGKRKEWEGIVILPIVDSDIIEHEYSKLIEKVSTHDMRRNIVGKSFIYSISDVPVLFKSYFGDIDNCMVKLREIDLN